MKKHALAMRLEMINAQTLYQRDIPVDCEEKNNQVQQFKANPIIENMAPKI